MRGINQSSVVSLKLKVKVMESRHAILFTLLFQPCTPDSYTSVPGDCESFQACLWGRYEVFHCAPGLHFNERTRICDWPSRANCQDNSVSTDNQDSSIPSNKPVDRPTSTEKTWEESTTQATTTMSSAVIDPDQASPLSGYYKVKSLKLQFQT